MSCFSESTIPDIENMMDPVNPNEEHLVIPEQFKKYIIKELLLPYYKTNIEYIIKTKSGWARVSTGFLTASTLLVGISSILSFASGVYLDKHLNFVAGSIGLISLVFKEFASYANNIDHVKTLTINDMLKNVGINHIMRDTSRNNETLMEKQKILKLNEDKVSDAKDHNDQI